MSQRTASLIRKAVRHVRKFGIDGQMPVEELNALDGRDDLLAQLEQALRQASADDLAATIHVVRLLHCFELADTIGEVTLQRPSVLEARLEAVDTLSEAGRDIPDALLETMTEARDFLAAPDADRLAVVLRFATGWRDAVLHEWLEAGDVPAPELLRDVLAVSPEIAIKAIGRLGDAGAGEAVEILTGLAASEDKALSKEARRALHRLRGRGVEIAEARPAGEFTLEITADVRAEARGWITGVDGFGGRVLWVLAPNRRGEYRLLEAVVNDLEGLRKADIIQVSRKGFREHIDRLRSEPGILVAQRPVGALMEVLSQAERLREAAGGECPEAWGRWRQEVGEALHASAAADSATAAGAGEVRGFEGDTNAEREALRESVSLLADPAFANWAVVGDSAEKAAREVRSAETSNLVVDETQRKQRVDQAMSSAADVFDDAMRRRYRQRLEAMAEMLTALRRREHARLAQAAATGFTEVKDLYADHPFARALIQRGVLAAYQSVRQQEDKNAEPSPVP